MLFNVRFCICRFINSMKPCQINVFKNLCVEFHGNANHDIKVYIYIYSSRTQLNPQNETLYIVRLW